MSEPPNPMKPLTTGLSQRFKSLERRAQATLELAERVRAVLPAPEKDHITAASHKADTLVVLADSAAWAARIRYAQQELLTRLQETGEMRFTKLKVKVGRVKE